MGTISVLLYDKIHKYKYEDYNFKEFVKGRRRHLYIKGRTIKDAAIVKMAVSGDLSTNQGLVVKEINVDEFLFSHAKKTRYHTKEYEAVHGPQVMPIANQAEADWVYYDLFDLILADTADSRVRYILYGEYTEYLYGMITDCDSILYVKETSGIKNKIKNFFEMFIPADYFIKRLLKTIYEFKHNVYSEIPSDVEPGLSKIDALDFNDDIEFDDEDEYTFGDITPLDDDDDDDDKRGDK